jgi:uncharacterized SAM-dependent methyltransferase
MVPIDREISESPSVFRDDVIRGLRSKVKTIPCKYLYDERGAALFEAICKTREYYPTRTAKLSAGRRDQKIKTFLIRQLVGLVFGFGVPHAQSG